MAELERIQSASGFIAALDQSGGSTPKALALYGINKSDYSDDAQMFDLVHAMRSRIITSPSFTSNRILAVILFEATMERSIEGQGSAEYLLQVKGIPSFLKVDNGLEDEAHGVQLMKEIPQLQDRITAAHRHGVVGTKMRSLIKLADSDGIEAILDQQFELAEKIIAGGLLPIIEPEIDIKSVEKSEAEAILLRGLKSRLDALPVDSKVVLKLTLPEKINLYQEFTTHPNVLRVAALSGGYSRGEANERLAENSGLIASFSRALTEGLNVGQSDIEFNQMLEGSIEAIYRASMKVE